MPPLQLPKNARGSSLCRHTSPGSCTWWCAYRLFTYATGIPVLVLVAIIVPILLAGGLEGHARLRDAAIAMALWLALVVPMIVFANLRDRRGHRP